MFWRPYVQQYATGCPCLLLVNSSANRLGTLKHQRCRLCPHPGSIVKREEYYICGTPITATAALLPLIVVVPCFLALLAVFLVSILWVFRSWILQHHNHRAIIIIIMVADPFNCSRTNPQHRISLFYHLSPSLLGYFLLLIR